MQAILSQFSKTKASADDDDENNAMISRLQEEDDDDEVDPDIDDDDGDEIDSAVEASDNAMVDDVVREVELESFGEETLTREDINLGRFSLSKVCSSTSLFHISNFMSITAHQSRKENLQQPNTSRGPQILLRTSQNQACSHDSSCFYKMEHDRRAHWPCQGPSPRPQPSRQHGAA
jgi:hypothetical protein